MALDGCLAALGRDDRQLIRLCYQRERRIREVAQSLDRTPLFAGPPRAGLDRAETALLRLAERA